MAYKFSIQQFESNNENLDHVPEFRDIVNNMIESAATVNSVGWRPDTGYKFFSYIVARGIRLNVIEIFKPNCDYFSMNNPLVKVYNNDVTDFDKFLPVEDRDILIWQDGPEHLSIDSGKAIISQMQQDFRGIVIATPNGEYPQSNLFQNEAERHLSGWTISDYEELGFNVTEYNPQGPGSCHPVNSFLIGYWRQ
jgi:hypothetical protein